MPTKRHKRWSVFSTDAILPDRNPAQAKIQSEKNLLPLPIVSTLHQWSYWRLVMCLEIALYQGLLQTAPSVFAAIFSPAHVLSPSP